MTKPTIRLHNVTTDEIIDREMNAAEFAQWQSDQATYEIAQAEAKTKAADKAALLAKLGITADEAKLLLN